MAILKNLLSSRYRTRRRATPIGRTLLRDEIDLKGLNPVQTRGTTIELFVSNIMNITELNNYSFSSDLIKRCINEETVMMYNPQNGDMYELNDVSAVIIDGLCKGMTGNSILESLSSQYDVEQSVIIEDISPLLDRLVELKLLKIHK